jgi:hypothetical protein
MAGTGDDVINSLTSLAVRRSDFEWAWRQVAKVAAPDAAEFTSGIASSGRALAQATATRRSKDIYDSTAVWAVDRLASGIEGLVIPQSEFWHGLDIVDLTKEDPTDEEMLWLERTRNMLFKVRYDADSGWIAASQTALRRMVAFGNAFIFTEESNTGHDSSDLIRYMHLPLNECYADENYQGVIDTFYRQYQLTARQAVQKFDVNLPEAVKRAAASPNDANTMFYFIHCIRPRADFGRPSEGVKKAPWASIHVEVESRMVVGESGYYEFPIVDFRWLPEPGRIYGEGPVMKALADIQSLNLMAKNELVAGQQAIDPPLLIPHAGIMNRPNTNPGAINFGGMSANGQKLIEPLFTGQRLDFATAVLESKRQQVKDSLYLNLFQILAQKTSTMTATEALIKADEKGNLLGPAGTRLQQSMSGMVERELGILGRKGMYAKGSAYYPPQSVIDKDIGAHFTGPLSRMRKAKEAEATIQMLNIMSPLAQVDPSVVDSIDPDATTRGLADILGVPKKFLRTMARVEEVRAARAESQAAAQQAAIAKDMAAASKSGVEALTSLQATGGV